jgi:hypothetical protein
MKTEELEDLIKQVYFYCENKDPNGLYPDRDIDLREFASKLIAVYEAKIKVQQNKERPSERHDNQAPVCSLLASR